MELTATKAKAIRDRGLPVLLISMPDGCRVHELEKDGALIGAGEDCDIRIQLPGIAERHVLLQRHDSFFECFDLSGSEGLLLNGSRQEAGELHHGDKLVLGLGHFLAVDPSADSMPPGLQVLALPMPMIEEAALAEAEAGDASESSGDPFRRLKQAVWLLIAVAMHAAIWIAVTAFLEAPPEEDRRPEISVEVVDADDLNEQIDPEDEIVDEEPEIDEEELDEPVEPEVADSDLESEVDIDDAVFAEPSNPAVGMREAMLGENGRGISGGGVGAGANGSIARKVGQLRNSGLDIVVLLDATGSMGQEIAAAKREISSLIASLSALRIEFRLGVVAFRDRGEDFIVAEEELTGRVYKAVDFIDKLRAGGGGDIPEAVHDAFRVATRMRFSRKADKVLVLVGDAPPRPGTEGKLMQLVKRFHKRGGTVHTIYTETDDWVGRMGETRRVFAEIAQNGGGEAVDLDHAADLVRNVLRLTLESENEREIDELVADLGEGLTSNALRRRLSRHDADFVEKMLRRRPMNARLPLELVKANHEAFLPAYISVLRDREVSLRNRWLVTVLLRRLLNSERGGIPAAVRKMAVAFDPEEGATKQKRLLDELALALYDAGLIATDSPEDEVGD